ncbi:hypothetical protein [Ktedonospora formicarum]|uniref:hypothetical protein n=1 Tax=Ktedonospora formicarum TaxID=2778364 RepID=UPI001C68E994|nr:hypothetical protein [Ktedonospora formicarum]
MGTSAMLAMETVSSDNGARTWLMLMLVVGVLLILIGCGIAVYTLYTYRRAR